MPGAVPPHRLDDDHDRLDGRDRRRLAHGSFAKRVNCLTFGVSFWVTLAVWAVYWAVVWLFRQQTLAADDADDTELATKLSAIGAGVEDLWTVVAVVAWQIACFGWLSRGLARACGSR